MNIYIHVHMHTHIYQHCRLKWCSVTAAFNTVVNSVPYIKSCKNTTAKPGSVKRTISTLFLPWRHMHIITVSRPQVKRWKSTCFPCLMCMKLGNGAYSTQCIQLITSKILEILVTREKKTMTFYMPPILLVPTAHHPDPLCGPPSLLSNRYWGLFPLR
jgi:hypothetical protein